jgi:hypothetical protein
MLSKVIKVVTLVTCTRDVPGSNLGRDTYYLERFFLVLPSPSEKMAGQYLRLSQDHFLPYPSQFSIH